MKSDSSWAGASRRLIQSRFAFYCVAVTAGLSLMFMTLVLLRWHGDVHRPEADVNVRPQQSGSRDIQAKHTIANESANVVVLSDQGEHDLPPPMRVTLEFASDHISLDYHLGKEGRGFSKGEVVRPGYISFWTGWTYPELRELGEGNHLIVSKRESLSQRQLITLRVDP